MESEPTLRELSEKLDALTKTLDSMRKYFLATFWITIVFLVLPLIGAFFIVPSFMTSYVGSMDAATLEMLEGL